MNERENEEHTIVEERRQIINALKIYQRCCKNSEYCGSECAYGDICNVLESESFPQYWNLPNPDNIPEQFKVK